MMIMPVKEGMTLPVPHFPTDFQALIFRLWEMVPASKIAEIINTDEKTVKELACDMGLGEQKYLEKWMDCGYISILRNVWNILSYEQIMHLLGWTEERLNYVLKEDDYIGIKLAGWGRHKFDCKPVVYRPLTDEEKIKTAKIKETVLNDILPLDDKEMEPPFEFFKDRYKALVPKKQKEVVVDSTWGMKISGDAEAVEFAESFKSDVLETYGVSFKNSGDKNITIDVCLDSADEEYHEIDINTDSINIRTVSSIGVLRALNFLLDLADGTGTLSFDVKKYKRKTKFKTRFIYSFCGLYGDILDKPSEISFPDKLLKLYARQAINGVWILGVFSTMTPYPFKEGLDKGWETRLNNLRLMTERLAKYGIKVYIYINEPRQLPIEEFEKFPHLKGRMYEKNNACLCSSHPEVHKYLRDSVKRICETVPKLGGFMCITQSENSVTCVARKPLDSKVSNENEKFCPVCSERLPSEVTAEIISAMSNAVEEVNPDIKFFVYTWCWADFGKDLDNLLSLLPKNVIILSVSEDDLKFNIGGVEGSVVDYSLSIVGPSESSKELWRKSREKQLECAAKVQINNSWECSTAPFLPVYENIKNHMLNLSEAGVEHLMLSWTLGGYISDNIKIAASYFFEECENSDDAYETVLKNTYGDYVNQVKEAVGHFCKGFSEFPFHVTTMYVGPSNAGASNLLYPEKTGQQATMTCFPYDDLELWRANYPADIFLNQFEKLCAEWEKGLKCLEGMPVCEFYDMAVYGYTLFKASANQIKYYILRDSEKDAQAEMDEIVKSEKELALMAYEIMLRNSAVGYEAANHYYVSRSTLREKIVQCDVLLNK